MKRSGLLCKKGHSLFAGKSVYLLNMMCFWND